MENSEPVTVEVLGFDASTLVQNALNEIANCKKLHQLSERSAKVIGIALNGLHQQVAGSIVQID